VVAIAFDPNQVAALYFGIPFVVGCYLFFWFRYGRKGARGIVPVPSVEAGAVGEQ
jgi:S-methylmethionine transporter